MNSYKGNIKIILDLLKNLPNYRPMINSKEIDISFDYIKKKYLKDAQVHEFKHNSKAGDWVVPKRWKRLIRLILNQKIILLLLVIK